MIAFEGFGASGKGLQIGKLIQALDPRGFRVYAVKSETEEERMHPFLWRFWTKLPRERAHRHLRHELVQAGSHRPL